MVFLKVRLSENAAHKEARLSEVEAELARCRATCSRLEQVFSSVLAVIYCNMFPLICLSTFT